MALTGSDLKTWQQKEGGINAYVDGTAVTFEHDGTARLNVTLKQGSKTIGRLVTIAIPKGSNLETEILAAVETAIKA